MNLTSSNVFFFNIFVAGETSPRALTHNFNLTQSSTTTSVVTSTSATSTSTTPTSITSASSAITSAPTVTEASIPTSTGASNAPRSSSGLSTGAKAGIGLGVSVGGLALITAGLFFWRRRSGQRVAAGGPETGQLSGAPYESVHQQFSYKPPGAVTERSEALGNYVAPELTESEPAPPLEMADTSRPQHS
jgi:hypothetical protein